MMKILIISLSSIYLLYLFYEYRKNSQIRKSFRHIIHVNGTRGKSSVCRLADAGLRAGGYKVFTKTTGTSPRIIDVNGEEHEIYRKGRANIREQIKILKKAQKQNAEVLVIECMAVKPELQNVSQNKILNADIGVVTNVRRDHLEEMGPSLKDVAESLGYVMPKNGIFITVDENFYGYYTKLGAEKNTKTILVKSNKDYEIDFGENVELALEICNQLGVERSTALMGMRKIYKQDPGRLNIYRISTRNGKQVFFINAFAANDPDSTLKIYEYSKKMNFFNKKKFIVLVNNRIDRGYRMEQFVRLISNITLDHLWITGSFTKLMKKKLVINGLNEKNIEIYKRWNDLDFESIKEDTVIFAIGNIAGCGEKIAHFVEGIGEDVA